MPMSSVTDGNRSSLHASLAQVSHTPTTAGGAYRLLFVVTLPVTAMARAVLVQRVGLEQ